MIDVAIIGAGASGLVTAILAARRGKSVVILEKNTKVGKKLLATGNGKCNIANIRPTLEHFYSENLPFVAQMLKGYSFQTVKQFFKSIGLELIEAKEGKVFPMSLQASSVVELLAEECQLLNVTILLESRVEKLHYGNGSFSLSYNNDRIKAKRVVLATGHCSAPQLGGVRDGLSLAESLGHRLIEGFPTLVQLTSPYKESYLKRLSGVKVHSRVTLKSAKVHVQKEGDVLFTNYGLSGLAILDISRHVLEVLKTEKEVTLTIDLMPKMSREQLRAMLRKSLVKKSPKELRVWLQGFLHKKLIYPLLEPLKLENHTVGWLVFNQDKLDEIVDGIKSFSFLVNGHNGYRGAEVATGGIDTREVESQTMESKRQKGLYFTGEVLDLDGDRGGFNLHLAWVSALRVGENI
ncbi:MAG TPA: NAD(P)/FAD-dependent oxidoreductase [Campylobacterales bacterium]|nr:NAD(P)/FAD-dependent oxidoreductase [Campylobacterales bacterium]HHS93301.1 NAD(P)/FAD-dependent oxidoreductase [Campylobacterales bacterium]